MRRSAYVVSGLSAAVLVWASGACLAEEGVKMEGKKAPEKSDIKEKAATDAANPVVVIETSMGTIKAELWPDKAPETVKNFLQYVDDKYYDGLIFHRVISGFMIQCGGFTPDMKQKQTRASIKNEARPDVPNSRGTLAMARTGDPNSATSQFYINHRDNAGLDKGKCPDGFGYCAFGKVTEGLDVVDKIAKVKTGMRAGSKDVPVETVEMKSVRRAEAAAAKSDK